MLSNKLILIKMWKKIFVVVLLVTNFASISFAAWFQFLSRPNFEKKKKVDLHLLDAKPNPLFLSETGINDLISLQELSIPGYSPLIAKHDYLNHHVYGLDTYIKDVFPCDRDEKKRALIFHISIVPH